MDEYAALFILAHLEEDEAIEFLHDYLTTEEDEEDDDGVFIGEGG